MKDKASSVKVEVADNNLMRGGHILHEDEYNTGHGISAIPDEICGEIRRQPRQPEVQQEPVVHLLLEGPLGWDSGIFSLSVQTAPQPPKPAHRGGAETDPGYAPQEPQARHGGAVGPAEAKRLWPAKKNVRIHTRSNCRSPSLIPSPDFLSPKFRSFTPAKEAGRN